MLALLYLLCVLTPAVALAMPGGSPAPCLELPSSLTLGTSHQDMTGRDMAAMDHHAHDDMGAMSHDHMIPTMDHAAANDVSPQHDHHKSPQKPCCELMCMTALPAPVVAVAEPRLLASIIEDERVESAVQDVSPQRYRPPIS